MSEINPIKGVFYAFAGAMTFSSKAVFIKLAYEYGVDSVSLLLLRMLFSLPFFLFIAFSVDRKSSNKAALGSSRWIQLLLLGIIGYYLASIFDFIGLQYISASLERLILFIYPTIVVILSALFLKQRITAIQMACLALTYSGMVLVFWDRIQQPQNDQFWVGVAWIVAAAFTYASYLTGSEYVIGKIGAVRFTAIAMSIASLCVMIHFSLVQNWTNLLQLPWQVWGYGVVLALFCTVIPAFWVSHAIAIIGSSSMSIIASIGPITTIVLAYFFLGERLGWLQLSGSAVVLTGVVLLSIQSKRKARALAT